MRWGVTWAYSRWEERRPWRRRRVGVLEVGYREMWKGWSVIFVGVVVDVVLELVVMSVLGVLMKMN